MANYVGPDRLGSGDLPLNGNGTAYSRNAQPYYRAGGAQSRGGNQGLRKLHRSPSPAGKYRGSFLSPGRVKLLGLALALIMLHTLSANVITPSYGSASKRSSPAKPATETENIARLLSESGSLLVPGDAAITPQDAARLAKSTKDGRGRSIYTKRDALTNPFAVPPKTPEEARNTSNIKRYDPKKVKAVNYSFRDKCRNEAIVPYDNVTGMEWAMSCRGYVKEYGEQISKYRWCRGGNSVEVPDLKQLLQFKSNRTRNMQTVTIVTQLSLERISMLEQQCGLWPHAISAVVYIPMVKGKIFSAEEDNWHAQPLEVGIEAMIEFYDRMQDSNCILDLEVVTEERCTRDLAAMYPANAVRNRALMMTETDIVLLLDVDFVADLSLADIAKTPQDYQALLSQLLNHKALVLPAFEAWDQGEYGKQLALEAVKQGKEYISKKFMYNIVIGFHMSHYPQGHEKTNFWRWLNDTEPYEVEYQTGFEPYILMARSLVPYYDERFRGYYWNKVQHLMHISTQHKFTFVIHPHAFVVHVPHRKPATRWRTRKSGQKERNHIMFLEALEEMKKERFVPVTSFPHLCMPPEIALAAMDVVPNPAQKQGLEESIPLVALPASELAYMASLEQQQQSEELAVSAMTPTLEEQQQQQQHNHQVVITDSLNDNDDVNRPNTADEDYMEQRHSDMETVIEVDEFEPPDENDDDDYGANEETSEIDLEKPEEEEDEAVAVLPAKRSSSPKPIPTSTTTAISKVSGSAIPRAVTRPTSRSSPTSTSVKGPETQIQSVQAESVSDQASVVRLATHRPVADESDDMFDEEAVDYANISEADVDAAKEQLDYETSEVEDITTDDDKSLPIKSQAGSLGSAGRGDGDGYSVADDYAEVAEAAAGLSSASGVSTVLKQSAVAASAGIKANIQTLNPRTSGHIVGSKGVAAAAGGSSKGTAVRSAIARPGAVGTTTSAKENAVVGQKQEEQGAVLAKPVLSARPAATTTGTGAASTVRVTGKRSGRKTGPVENELDTASAVLNAEE